MKINKALNLTDGAMKSTVPCLWWLGYNFHPQLKNKYLTLAFGDQYCTANYGQGPWFFQYIEYY